MAKALDVLITGGTIVTAAETYRADVGISGETIAAVGADLSALAGTATRRIDAGGAWVIPGGIDPHVHMSLPFMGTVSVDDFTSGSVCAVAGGTTSLIDFAIPAKGATLKSALDAWDAKAKGKSIVDYSYHMTLADWSDGIAAEVGTCVREWGINSFKTFTAYRGVLMIDDQQLFKALRTVTAAGGITTVHAVNGDVLMALAEEHEKAGTLGPNFHDRSQPVEAEGEATYRVLSMGAIAKAPVYVVHISCDDALESLQHWRTKGRAPCYGESCTQYFFLTRDLYEKPNFEGAKYVLSPPIREAQDCEAMWTALANGLIQTIGTDHCAFSFKGQKDMGKETYRKIPNGLNGLEERLPLIYTGGVKAGRISANRWVEACSTNVAKIFGLYPKKGTVAVGADADLVVWDPDSKGRISAKTHRSKCDYNVFEGFETAGAAKKTLVRGRLVWDEGKVLGEPGHGRFLKRPPFRAGLGYT